MSSQQQNPRFLHNSRCRNYHRDYCKLSAFQLLFHYLTQLHTFGKFFIVRVLQVVRARDVYSTQKQSQVKKKRSSRTV